MKRVYALNALIAAGAATTMINRSAADAQVPTTGTIKRTLGATKRTIAFAGTSPMVPRRSLEIVAAFDPKPLADIKPADIHLAAAADPVPATALHGGLSAAKLKVLATQHRFQHCEMLLGQAISLLTEILNIRDQWQSLRVDDYLAKLDSRQFDALDQIHKQETTAGYYTIDAQTSGYAGQAVDQDAAALKQLANAAAKSITDLFTTPASDSNIGQPNQTPAVLQQIYAAMSAYLAHIRPQYKGDTTYVGVAAISDNTDVNDPVTGKPITVTGDALNMASFAAIGATKFNLALQQNALSNQRDQFTGQLASAQSRSAGADGRAAFDKAMIPFRLARTQVSREVAADKKAALTSPNGALNYRERMRSLQGRFFERMTETIARLIAVRQGLSLIYNYNPQFTLLSGEVVDGLKLFEDDQWIAKDPNYIDDVVRWAALAQVFLVRFAQNEQSFVLPISLQALLGGDAAFQRGLSRNGRGGMWDITIKETDFFIDLRNVRLRGVSVYPKADRSPTSDPAELWQAVLRVPQSSYYRYPNNQTSAQINQEKVPLLRAARLRPRDRIAGNGDVFGAVAGFNVSPFGMWRIVVADAQGPLTIDGKNGSTDVYPQNRAHNEPNKLTDVVIDLQLSALYAS